MQFHFNGFKKGDPEIAEPVEGVMTRTDRLPDDVDVLIVGCGPAGLTLAAQLATFGDICTCIVEQKPGPIELGQADGVACRTVEMFQAFGFAERLLKEAYWVNETAFWKPSETQRENIVRSGRIQDVEDGLSEFPHVILNQARVHEFYLSHMRNSPRRLEPYYGRRFTDLKIDNGAADYPVTVAFERVEGKNAGTQEIVKARYVVGCDGARSAVRRSLGIELRGDAANQAWGVMDVLAVTDFPDIRLKSVIQSSSEGSIIIIPREGGYLARIYVELDKLNADERVAERNITIDYLIAAAQRILHPYSLDVKEVAWWSVYEIGQRIADRFDDVHNEHTASDHPRVFIAGDACHTHSPKAGQGMNVSMQDAFNLGWKLTHVLRGWSDPALLRSYSSERHEIAKILIDFDREWAAMISAPLKSETCPNGVEPAEVQRYFIQSGRYTAGTATRYSPSILTGSGTYQTLARGFEIGTRLHSAPVIRLADGKPVHLGHAAQADGRWRLFAFADAADPMRATSAIQELCEFLANGADSPVRKYTPAGLDIDAVIDVRAIFQQAHRALDLGKMPSLLRPRKGRYGLVDYEKMFCPDLKGGQDIFDMRGIDREYGCMVIVRPDQYVSDVLPISARKELDAFFAGVLTRRPI